MKLQKSADNSMYQAKMGDRRIRLYTYSDHVQIHIKRTVDNETLAKPKEIKTRGNKTVTIDAVCGHITDRRTAELVFQLSDEAAHAMLDILATYYRDHKEGQGGCL